MRHEGVKRMVVGFAGVGGKRVRVEGSLGAKAQPWEWLIVTKRALKVSDMNCESESGLFETDIIMQR